MIILAKETAGDTLLGDIDGSNRLYTVSYDYQVGSVIVYVDGQRRIDALDDGYLEIPPRQVELKEALLVGDTLEVEYAIETPETSIGGALGGVPTTADATEDLPTVLTDSRLPSQVVQNLEPRSSLEQLLPVLLARDLRPVILDVEDEE